jgi:regulatory protein
MVATIPYINKYICLKILIYHSHPAANSVRYAHLRGLFMSCITGIERSRQRRRAFLIYIDHDFFCEAEQAVVDKLGLKVGQPVEPEELKALIHKEKLARAREKCLRLLDIKARTQKELAQRLQRDGVEAEIITAVLTTLRQSGLIDDEAYARAFVRERIGRKAQGFRRLQAGLLKKGINRRSIDAAWQEVDAGEESTRCASVARKKMPAYQTLPISVAKRRLSAFLIRQGFEPEHVGRAVRQVFSDTGDEENDV